MNISGLYVNIRFRFSWIIPRDGIAESYKWMFNFLRHFQILPTSVEESQLFYIVANTWYGT